MKKRYLVTVTCTERPHVRHHYWSYSVEQANRDWGRLFGYAPHQFSVVLDPHPEYQEGQFEAFELVQGGAR